MTNLLANTTYHAKKNSVNDDIAKEIVACENYPNTLNRLWLNWQRDSKRQIIGRTFIDIFAKKFRCYLTLFTVSDRKYLIPQEQDNNMINEFLVGKWSINTNEWSVVRSPGHNPTTNKRFPTIIKITTSLKFAPFPCSWPVHLYAIISGNLMY